MCASRSSASLMGVLDTPNRATSGSSDIRSPGANSPRRSVSRRWNSAWAVWDATFPAPARGPRPRWFSVWLVTTKAPRGLIRHSRCIQLQAGGGIRYHKLVKMLTESSIAKYPSPPLYTNHRICRCGNLDSGARNVARLLSRSQGETACMRTALKSLALLVVLLLPAPVFAQASLTGTVRDGSGGVLPGVTVEASSPALIQKTRTAVTDGSGQYRIVDLVPGTYSLTFTLPGFSSVKRDGIELTGNQTLTIPVDLRVGGIEETITVTGESPVVDVQSATRQLVMSDELISTIPATRAAGALLNATPGIVVGETGAALSPTMTAFNARSSTINQNTVAGE